MMMMKNMDVRLDYTKHHKTLLSWCIAMSAPTDDWHWQTILHQSLVTRYRTTVDQVA